MPKANSVVNFFFLNSSLSLKDRKGLKRFIVSIFNKERKRLETINYVFTDDRYLLEINRKYLSHNFLTDIITFELSNEDQPVTAEVYISAERVKENAVTHKTTLKNELLRVIFHGALHLCGYSDKTTKQANRMREKEDYYIAEYFR